MESSDRLRTEAGKVAHSSIEVQKVFKHVFYLAVPFSLHFWHIFYRFT